MKQFFANHIKAVAIIIVVIVALGALWYVRAGAAPVLGSYAIAQGNVAGALDEPGTVIAQDISNIAFQESGQILHVYVSEGDTVNAGAPLADLSSASFRASVQQANASLAAAQAKLAELTTGATPQAIAVSQTAVATAQQSLANTYASAPNTITDAYAKSNDAVRTQLVNFFSSPETNSPQLTFGVNNSQVVNDVQSLRLSASTELNTWQAELASTTTGISNAALDAELQSAANHLTIIQNLMNEVETAFTDQTDLSETATAAYKASATAGLTETNAAVTEITNMQQGIASEDAAIAQAQAGLNLTTASSTMQEIQAQEAAVAQAQATVASAQVGLDNASLIAPFTGTVQNLTAKVGEVVSPGMSMMSLVNNGGLQIQTYVSESDVAKIKAGDMADVTLDAFGTDMTFPATVTTIDSAETSVNGTPSYLVTLYFTNPEPQIKDGMTGNVHITLAEAQGVIAIPSRLVLNDGNENIVLLQTPSGIQKQIVTIGLVGDDGMTEITSGLDQSDTLANF